MNTFLTTILVAFVAFISVGSLLDGDYAPLVYLGVAFAMPLLLYAFCQALAWRPGYVHILCVALIFFQSSVLRVRDIDDKSIDAQVLLKLSCIGVMFLLTFTAVWRQKISLIPLMSDVILWSCFLVYLVGTTMISVNPTTAFVEASSNVAAFVFLLAVSMMLGPRAVVEVLLVACLCLCVASLAVYFAVPQLGRMSDWVNGSFIPTSRLQGVFGAANAAGAAGAFGILAIYLFSGISKRSLKFYALNAPFVACLILSNNRMAIAAVIGAMIFVSVRQREATLKLAIGVCLASIGALLFANFGDIVLEKLSRSGSADEITSGTGRTRIWTVVIQMWWDRPFFGYGVGSAKYILPHHPLLFKAAAHAHNLYLNILFSGGAVGLTIFIINVSSAIQRLWRRNSHEALGMILFFLIYGITEPTIGGLVSFLSMSFYAIIVFSFYSKKSLMVPVRWSPWKWLIGDPTQAKTASIHPIGRQAISPV